MVILTIFANLSRAVLFLSMLHEDLLRHGLQRVEDADVEGGGGLEGGLALEVEGAIERVDREAWL